MMLMNYFRKTKQGVRNKRLLILYENMTIKTTTNPGAAEEREKVSCLARSIILNVILFTQNYGNDL